MHKTFGQFFLGPKPLANLCSRLYDYFMKYCTRNRAYLFCLASLLGQSLWAQPLPRSGDIFFDDLNAIRRTVQNQSGALKNIGWFTKDPDPIPSRDYTATDAERMPWSQQVVLLNGTLYFIDRGFIFEKDQSSGRTRFLEGSSDVTSILIYKNVLVALDSGGKVFMWGPGRNWNKIGTHTRQILVAANDLVALTQNNELWVYKETRVSTTVESAAAGLVAGAALTSKSIVLKSLALGTFSALLVDDDVSFFDSGIRGVLELKPIKGEKYDIKVNFKDTSSNYSQLREAIHRRQH